MGEAEPPLGAVINSEELQTKFTEMLWRDKSHSPYTPLSPALISFQTFTLLKKYILRENKCEGDGGVCLENTHIKTQ